MPSLEICWMMGKKDVVVPREGRVGEADLFFHTLVDVVLVPVDVLNNLVEPADVS